MDKYATIWKEVGETPLQALERFRSERMLSKEIPLAYAGRLDPMADGLLLVIIGEECKHQKEYHGLDKEYVFRVLVGYQSDTHDILGIAERITSKNDTCNLLTTVSKMHVSPELKKKLRALTGKITLPFPAFSARTVRGKPLHERTLEGSLLPGETPLQTSTVYSLTLTSSEAWSRERLTEEIFSRINSFPEVTDARKALGKDFRRTEVRARWNELLTAPDTPSTFRIVTFHCICSSGTYMRSLAHELGGLALSITRPTIGRYFALPLELGFWWKKY